MLVLNGYSHLVLFTSLSWSQGMESWTRMRSSLRSPVWEVMTSCIPPYRGERREMCMRSQLSIPYGQTQDGLYVTPVFLPHLITLRSYQRILAKRMPKGSPFAYVWLIEVHGDFGCISRVFPDVYKLYSAQMWCESSLRYYCFTWAHTTRYVYATLVLPSWIGTHNLASVLAKA